ncbi:MAG: hypothetical protein BWY92_00691 [Firmicutes bacterium ADurb.BinA052]|nr:MAG: hypothetical protein BWY92_00691 [Firmicutes bacterium ADurb.BinA052]
MPYADAHVLDEVVVVYFDVAGSPYLQVQPTVERQQSEHVFEKSAAGRDVGRPAAGVAVETEKDVDICLRSLAVHAGLSRAWHVNHSP